MKVYIQPITKVSNSKLPYMVITCSGGASETHNGASGDGHPESTDGMGGTGGGGDDDFTQGAKNRFYF